MSYQGFGAPEIIEVIVEQLRRVGIDVTTQELEYSAYIDKGVAKKDFDVIFRVGFTGPDPSLLVSFIGTGGFQNVMSYSNPKVDALLAQGNSVFNQQRRAVIYSQVEQILLADMPRVPLFDRRVAFPASPSYKDFWVDSTPGGLQQAAMSYERAWWIGGKPIAPRP